MSHKQMFSTFFMFLLISAIVAPLNAVSWEPPMVIAGDANHLYYKPEVVFGPSGAVYITYRDKNQLTTTSDIMLCKWDGKKMVTENVSNLGNVWSRFDAEESDIFVDQNETIHVAWIGADSNAVQTRHIMYRYKEGNKWSEIFYLGEMSLPNSLQYVIDTRLKIDSRGNAHVVTCIDAEDPAPRAGQGVSRPSISGSKTSWYVAKYGDVITPPYQFSGHNAKHPDLAVDDNYVYATWMYKNTAFAYWIFVQKWENKPNATKGPIVAVTNPDNPYSSQKSRIDVDDQGRMHVLEFYKTDIYKKARYFVEQPDGSFAGGRVVSVDRFLLYHKADLRVKPNSVLVTMQQGASAGSSGNGDGAWFNWQRNGQWGACTRIPNSEYAKYVSNDLSADGEIAAVVWNKKKSQILFTSSAPITATGTLETVFSQPDTIFSGSEITFDASQCIDLNPEETITQYTWDFGDGTIETTASPTITHTYDIFHTTVEVKLTLATANGDDGEGSKELYIDALYGAPITSLTRKLIRTLFYNRQAYEITWSDNPLNESKGYPTITTYEIWRAPQSGSVSDDSYVKMGETAAGEHKYIDFNGVKDGVNYIYAIRSVDGEGHISPIKNTAVTPREEKKYDGKIKISTKID